MTTYVTPTGAAPAGGLGPTVGSSPYPWPYHGRLDPARSVLLACLDRSWRPDVPASDEADRRLRDLASALAGLGAVVVAATCTPGRRGGHGPVGGAADAAPPPGLPVRPDHLVRAGGTSAFFGSGLDGLLRRLGRGDVILAGWGLEGPVHSTMRCANDRGYECLLVPDASTPAEPALTGPALSMVEMSGGIFGAVAGTGPVLRALSELEPRREP